MAPIDPRSPLDISPAEVGAAAAVHTHPYVATSAVGAASGVASLDSGGKIPQAQLPAIALVDYLGSVASQSAMLALTGQRGDWCTRTDLGLDYQLIAEPPTTLGSWRAMTYPAAPVSSVNGRIGAVTGLPEGIVRRGRRTTNSTSSASTTPVSVQRLAAPVTAGRLYRVSCPLLMVAAAAALSGYALGVHTLRITTDGSNPTATSTLLAQAHTLLATAAAADQPTAGFIRALYAPTTSHTLTVLQQFYRGQGSAALYIAGNNAYPIDLLVEDLGPDPGATGTNL